MEKLNRDISKAVDENISICDGIVRITFDNCTERIFVDPEYDKPISLQDCLERAKQLGYTSGVLYVTFDTPLYGRIFMYGNYMDQKWYVYAETNGFA